MTLLGPLVTARLSTLPDIDYREVCAGRRRRGFLHVYGKPVSARQLIS